MQSSKVTAANELIADDTVLNEPENIPETNKPEIYSSDLSLQMF